MTPEEFRIYWWFINDLYINILGLSLEFLILWVWQWGNFYILNTRNFKNSYFFHCQVHYHTPNSTSSKTMERLMTVQRCSSNNSGITWLVAVTQAGRAASMEEALPRARDAQRHPAHVSGSSRNSEIPMSYCELGCRFHFLFLLLIFKLTHSAMNLNTAVSDTHDFMLFFSSSLLLSFPSGFSKSPLPSC